MGRDKNLPNMFGYISNATRTPAIALLWTALLIGFMVAFIPITTVAAAADIMFLLLFLQVNVAVITIRKKYGDKLAYGYLMPFYPIVPVIGIVTKLALALFMFDHYPIAWVYVLIWLVLGFTLYRFYAMDREREKKAPPVLAKEKALDVKPDSVLIAIADPESAKDHIRLGARIARRRESELVLLHAIQVPRQLPPTQASDFVEEARPILDESRDFAEDFDVPVSTVIRVGHDIASAIIHTAQDENTEYLIMGWKGSVHDKDTLIGSNIDTVLKESNTHAVVLQRTKEDYQDETVLAPIANPDSAPLLLTVASLVTDSTDGNVTVLHITEEPLDKDEKKAYRERLETFSREDELGPASLFHDQSRFSLEFGVTDDLITEIAGRSHDVDRIVLGTSRGGLLGRKIFGEIPTQIADRSECPVVLTRPKELGVKFEMQHFFQFFRDLEEEDITEGTSTPKGSEE